MRRRPRPTGGPSGQERKCGSIKLVFLNTTIKQMTHTGTRSIVHWTLGWPQLYKWFTMEHVLLSTEHWGGFNYTNNSHWNTLYCPLNTGVASTIQMTQDGTRSIVHWTLCSPQLYKWLTLEHALLSTEHRGHLVFLVASALPVTQATAVFTCRFETATYRAEM